MEAFFRMVVSWWEVFYSVNNSLAKTYAVEKYQIYSVEEKEKTQISAGSAKNKGYYLCFSKAVGNFCCILRLSSECPKSNQHRRKYRKRHFCWSVPLKVRKLAGKLTTGRVLWHAPRKSAFLLVFLAAPDYSNRSEKPHNSEKQFILSEWQVFILERIYLYPFRSPFKSIYLQKSFFIRSLKSK